MKKALPLFVPGVIFGAGLGVSGMTNPAKVLGFLDLFGEWDPSLAFVMVGAIGAFAALYRPLARRETAVQGGAMPGKPTGNVDTRLWIGATLFGVGWGIGGFCPGPAITNLGGLHVEAFVFVPAMAVGMLIAQRVFGADS